MEILGRREKFPIFFRRGKLPLGPYKVQGPQAQARKKSECPGEKPDETPDGEFFMGDFRCQIFCLFKKHLIRYSKMGTSIEM